MITGFGFRDTHGMVNALRRGSTAGSTPATASPTTRTSKGPTVTKIAHAVGQHVSLASPTASHIEYFTHGQVNPFGLAFDPLGNICSRPIATRSRPISCSAARYYPSFGKPHDGLGFGPPMMEHPHGSTGIAGIVYYAADQFPRGVSRHALHRQPDHRPRSTHDKLERTRRDVSKRSSSPTFLSCDDPWFRPVDIKLGPGRRAVHRRLLQLHHRPLRSAARRTRSAIASEGGFGASFTPAREPSRRRRRTWPQAGFDELVKLLGHANLTVRTAATNRLATEKRSRDEVRSLIAVLENRRENARRRAHIAWVLQRIDHTLFDEEVDIVNVVLDNDQLVKVHALSAWTEQPKFDDVATMEKTGEFLVDPYHGPFARLAAAEAEARIDDLNVLILVNAWRATPPEDKQLIYALRLAIKSKLGTGDRLASFLDGVATNEAKSDDRRRLAEICLAIPDRAAADFILDVLRDHEIALASPKPYIEHAAHHLAAKRLPQLEEYCTTFHTAPIERRLEVYRALCNGLATRNKTLPTSIADDLDAIVLEKLRGTDEATAKQGIELAKEFRRAEYFAALLPLIARSQRWTQLRPLAIEACATCDAHAATPVLTGIMNDPLESSDIAKKAVQQLAALQDDDARAALLATLTDAPQQLAFDIAAAIVISPEGAEALLEAVAAGKASPRLLQEGPVVFWLARSNPRDWNQRVKTLTAHLPPPDDRIGKLIAERAAAVHKAKPDLVRGEAIFKKNCAACHKIGGQGTKLGPELDGIGRRGVERLLEDMLDPSRTVDQAFRATQFTLADGRLLTGLVLREEGEVVVVADAQGKEVRLGRSEIEERQMLPLSPMPANVLELVGERDLPHLVGFLLASDQVPTQGAPAK